MKLVCDRTVMSEAPNTKPSEPSAPLQQRYSVALRRRYARLLQKTLRSSCQLSVMKLELPHG
jgi:hypothetical protein